MSHQVSHQTRGPISAEDPPYVVTFSVQECPDHGPEWHAREAINGMHPARMVAVLAELLSARLHYVNDRSPAPLVVQMFIDALDLMCSGFVDYAERNERYEAERRLDKGEASIPDHP